MQEKKPFKPADIPEYVPTSQRGIYDQYTDMMESTEEQRQRQGSAAIDTLQSWLDKIPGFTDLSDRMTSMLGQMSSGQITDTQQQVLNQEANAQRLNMFGTAQGGSAINMSLASLGQAGLQAQRHAMSVIPQWAQFQYNVFAPTMQSARGPSYEGYAAQAQADHRDIYDSRVAIAEAKYQADMLNTQYNIQKQEQAASQARLDAANKAAQERADRLANLQLHNQASMANTANYGAAIGNSNPFTGGLQSRWARQGRGSRGQLIV